MGYLDNSFHTVLTKDCPGILLFQTLRLSDIFLILKLCIICRTRFFPLQILLLKVHKHELFFDFFCRNRNLMVPRACNRRFLIIVFDSAEIFDFPRMLSMRWNCFRVCSVCDEVLTSLFLVSCSLSPILKGPKHDQVEGEFFTFTVFTFMIGADNRHFVFLAYAEHTLKGTQTWNFFFYFFCRNRNLMAPRACNTRFLKIVFDSAEIFHF